MPFYKRENEELLIAPNFVISPTFELREESHDQNTYPVEGWHWFPNLDAAMAALSQSVAVTITRRQGRLALLEHGLLDDVEAALAAIPDATQRRAAQIEYEADTWERNNAFLQTMWANLGGTSEGLDALFALAATK